jgi:hypothetical protein
MPTSCIEAIRPIATRTLQKTRNRLIQNNLSQSLTTPIPTATSLIVRGFTIRNQQVAGSIPAGGSNLGCGLRGGTHVSVSFEHRAPHVPPE